MAGETHGLGTHLQLDDQLVQLSLVLALLHSLLVILAEVIRHAVQFKERGGHELLEAGIAGSGVGHQLDDSRVAHPADVGHSREPGVQILDVARHDQEVVALDHSTHAEIAKQCGVVHGLATKARGGDQLISESTREWADEGRRRVTSS